MKPTLTQMGARVIAKRHADLLGQGWKHAVKEVPQDKGDPIYIPTVYCDDNLIGLQYHPSKGWMSAIGLRSETAGGTQVLIKAYSDLNQNPRMAILESLNRMRKAIDALKVSFERLDKIDRAIQRQERPDIPIPDVPTFEEWWSTFALPPGTSDVIAAQMKDVAQTAWNARP